MLPQTDQALNRIADLIQYRDFVNIFSALFHLFRTIYFDALTVNRLGMLWSPRIYKNNIHGRGEISIGRVHEE
jgi:hypothetical protein